MLLLFALLTLALPAAANTSRTIPPVVLGGDWTPIPLPDMPLGFVSHAGVFWVCGANEMIASSSDGGRNWTLRHEKPGGELLFTLAFGSKSIQAFGSGGVRLLSNDGGASWREETTIPRIEIEKVAVASDRVFYAASGRNITWSSDGGQGWRLATLTSDPEAVIVGVAALDARHAAFLFEPGQKKIDAGDAQWLVAATSDQGRHWGAISFAKNWAWTELAAVGGGYRLQGRSASPAQAAAAVSPDGSSWKIAPPPAAPDQSGDTCLVGAALECTAGSSRPLPIELMENPNPGDHVINAGMVCEACPPPQFPENARIERRQGDVVFRALVGTDGSVRQLVTVAAAWADLESAARRRLRTWKYHPFVYGGQPQVAHLHITVHFTLGR